MDLSRNKDIYERMIRTNYSGFKRIVLTPQDNHRIALALKIDKKIRNWQNQYLNKRLSFFKVFWQRKIVLKLYKRSLICEKLIEGRYKRDNYIPFNSILNSMIYEDDDSSPPAAASASPPEIYGPFIFPKPGFQPFMYQPLYINLTYVTQHRVLEKKISPATWEYVYTASKYNWQPPLPSEPYPTAPPPPTEPWIPPLPLEPYPELPPLPPGTPPLIGRVGGSGSISKKEKKDVKRSARKKQKADLRMKKIQEMMDKKRSIGGQRGASICVTLVPLSPSTNVNFTLQFILSNCKSFCTIVGQTKSATYLKLSNGKNIMLATPASNDIWTVLDTLKQTDIALFLLPIMEPISPEGLTLIKAAKDQGLPTPFIGVLSSFSKTEEKSLLKSVHKSLSVDKIYSITNAGQISNLLRMMSVSKITIPRQWTQRSSLLIENYSPLPAINPATLHHNYLQANGPESNCNLLEVTGVIRRKNLNPYQPVLISGAGTFQILRVDVTPLEVPKEFISPEQLQGKELEDPLPPPMFLLDPLNVPQEEESEKQGEEEVDDDMDSDMDQDFDDLDDEEGDSSDDDQSLMSLDNGEIKKGKGRLPKGTSEYQANWLVNSDGEAEDEIIGLDEERAGSDDESEGDDDDDDANDEMDWEEEKRQLQISKDAKTEAEFPDWVDTPLETPAKVRFQKYRGLQSFKNSGWDPNENLPKDYKKIFQFQNFKHVYKVVLGRKAVDDGHGYIPVGQRVTLILKPLEESSSRVDQMIGSSKLTSLVSLLRHETRMSVLNFQLNLTEVLKNKEELIFQVGYHRFQAKPILSEVSLGNKHKMLRFGQVNQTCMATVFGPIVFPPASVLAFKSSKAELVPVGSGSLFSLDPSRLIIKRVLLSGHPFKVSNKKAVIRFMFFNREDIEWFKPIELKTRYGRRGHIKETLGTHGHMKCVFDGPMKSQDTVLMPLYKRVFPKWTYEPQVPSYTIFDSYLK